MADPSAGAGGLPIGGALMAGSELVRGITTAITSWRTYSIPEAQRIAEIKGIRQTVASYGRAIPIIIGTQRVAPNVIMMDPRGFAHLAGDSMHMGGVYEYWLLCMGLSICEGPILGIGGCWKDGLYYKSLADLDAAEIDLFAMANKWPDRWNLTTAISSLFLGTIPGPTDWTTGLTMPQSLASVYPPYANPGTAWLYHVAAGLGAPATAGPNFQFEVQGRCITSGQRDANAADVISLLVTDGRAGMGEDSTRINPATLTALENYAGAMGFGISWAITEQSSALDLIRLVLDACNCSAVDSGGQIKIVTYGDSDITANGYTYTANVTPVYTLTDDDFIVTPGQQPIRVTRKPEQSVPNTVPVEFLDARSTFSATASGQTSNSAYETKVVESPIMSDTTKTLATGKKKGLLRTSPIPLHCFTSKAAAQKRSKLYAQRSVYVRNTYTFRMSWRGILLEQGDLLRISSDAMGLSERVVRVIGRRRDRSAGAQGEVEITAEDSPLGTYHASAYTIEEGDGSAGLPVAVAPSSCGTPVIFMPPRRESDGEHYAWIATSGDSTVGGLDVWYSWDTGTTKVYSFAGSLGPCTYGVLAADLPVGPTIDDTNTLAVTLTSGTLATATTQDRDNLVTACWVDGEVLSYATATASGSDMNLTSLRRGCSGSLVAVHTTGDAFVRLDSSPVRIVIPDQRAGQTLYVKIPAWNQARTIRQTLDASAEYSFAVSGVFGVGSLPATLDWDAVDLEDWFIY